MKHFFAMIFLLALIPSLGMAENAAFPRVINDEKPSQGLQTLSLEELWRAGGEDDDMIFGRIVDVKRGPDGNTYVLDNQLCQVMVFSPEGKHLRDLSREGDGPGELHQPVQLAFLSDDVLGIGVGFPGKVITLKLDGTPDQTYYPIGVPSDGNIGLLMGVNFLEGNLVACGGRMVFNQNGEGHTDRFLSFSSGDFSQTNHILEKSTPLDLTGRRFVEATGYFVERSWVLGPGGLVYAAKDRNAYEVFVFDQTGKIVKSFGRKYEPRKRSKSEMDEVRPVINVNNNSELEVIAEKYDECISRIIFNHDDNTLWVLTPQGDRDQSSGILETWDVFSVEGEFLKQVGIPLGDEMNDGTLYLMGDDQLLLVKGTASAFSGNDNPDEDGEEIEVEPLEVICYRIR